jgi:hypothetical protein
MSAQHGEGSEGESQGLIRTPKQLITVVVLSFIVPVIGIVMLVWFVTGGKNLEPAGSSARAAESISDRMRPVGALWIAGETPPAGAAAAAAPAATVVAAAPAAAAAAPAGRVDGEELFLGQRALRLESLGEAVDRAARAPRLVHALDDLGLESQREDLHVDGLAVALARLARADRDAALLGLADLPDEVAAVVAARRAADRLEVLRLQLLDAHRREASPHVRRRGRARVGRGALLGGRLDRGRRALGRGRLLRSGGERLLDAPDEELPVRAA